MMALTYEAENSFSASLQDQAGCSEYVTRGGDFRGERHADRRVNGYTKFKWGLAQNQRLIDSLKQHGMTEGLWRTVWQNTPEGSAALNTGWPDLLQI